MLKHATLIPLAAAILMACQTTPKPEAAPAGPALATAEFTPADPFSSIHLEEGAHQDLFLPSSAALWVSPELTAPLQTAEAQSGTPPDPLLVKDADAINASFIVIECTLESMFGDMSMAYDAVGLRGADVYLLLPDGRKVRSLQRLMKNPIEEEQRDALKLFRRTNLLIFPRRDLLTEQPTVSGTVAGVKLVLAGFNSIYYFEWASGAPPLAAPQGPREAVKSLRLGFSELYGMIRPLAHAMD